MTRRAEFAFETSKRAVQLYVARKCAASREHRGGARRMMRSNHEGRLALRCGRSMERRRSQGITRKVGSRKRTPFFIGAHGLTRRAVALAQTMLLLGRSTSSRGETHQDGAPHRPRARHAGRWRRSIERAAGIAVPRRFWCSTPWTSCWSPLESALAAAPTAACGQPKQQVGHSRRL